MATSEQIVEMAKTIWPVASDIAVTRYKARFIPGVGSEPDGYKLSISTTGDGLIAVISAESLDGIKGKLERRSKKKHWGSFE